MSLHLNSRIVLFVLGLISLNAPAPQSPESNGWLRPSKLHLEISMRQFLLLCLIFSTTTCMAQTGPFFVAGEAPQIASQSWESVALMSDEFDGSELDTKKWSAEPNMKGFGWIGRPPGLFQSKNVSLGDGKMNVTVGKLDASKVVNGKEFKYYGAIVRSVEQGQVGWFYECRMKANATEMSSTFWLMTPRGSEKAVGAGHSRMRWSSFTQGRQMGQRLGSGFPFQSDSACSRGSIGKGTNAKFDQAGNQKLRAVLRLRCLVEIEARSSILFGRQIRLLGNSQSRLGSTIALADGHRNVRLESCPRRWRFGSKRQQRATDDSV